jgi:hypothetical protein
MAPVSASATGKCAATALLWKNAEPTKEKGWFFLTDDDSTAMDKWCDHNCHPKFPGQAAYCPASHCACDAVSPAVDAPLSSEGWECPLGRYGDGTCLCPAGTTECGSIDVPFVNGIATFDALTIGVAGKYVLSAQVVMPDLNTGSNRMQLAVDTGMFSCAEPAAAVGCAALPVFQAPAESLTTAFFAEHKIPFLESWVQRAGDSSICHERDATGACVGEPTTQYAMDKLCAAQGCPFNLRNLCYTNYSIPVG